MKRLFCLLSLLLCVCLLLPVFSVSVCAQDVNGNKVYTYWYIDTPEDSTLFENTIVNYTQPLSYVITTTIILADPIPKNNLFDFELGLTFNPCTFTDIQVTFLDSGSKKIDTIPATVYDNLLALSSLQFDSEVSKIVITFNITYATWTVVNTVYDVNIDGVNYNYEKNMTWSSWCRSNYNTLGLYVDNGFIYYGDSLSVKHLQTNGESVKSSDLISSNNTYYLESLQSVPTIINFTIDGVTYQSEFDMTWSAWVNSDYNTLGLYISDGQIYGAIENQTLYFQNTAVKDTESIISDRAYITRIVVPIYSFYVIHEGTENIEDVYEFEKGMTWADWIASDYNYNGFTKNNYGNNYAIYSDWGQRIYRATGNWNYANVYASDSLIAGACYGNKSFCETTGTLPYAAREYHYEFYITSVSTTIMNDNGLLNGIIAWLKQIKSDVTSIPNKILDGIGNVLRELFIPNSERLADMIEHTLGDYQSKFGVLAESVTLVDNLSSAFVYTDTQQTVQLPLVTVDLAGVPYSFGGVEVKIIPDGFDGIVSTLKLICNILATSAFLMAMKKRFKEMLRS